MAGGCRLKFFQGFQGFVKNFTSNYVIQRIQSGGAWAVTPPLLECQKGLPPLIKVTVYAPILSHFTLSSICSYLSF